MNEHDRGKEVGLQTKLFGLYISLCGQAMLNTKILSIVYSNPQPFRPNLVWEIYFLKLTITEFF